VNPLLANRCEQSPLDPRIWFLSVSLGGDYEVSCEVPSGAFLVLTPGGYECSTAEGNGSSDAELLNGAEVNFEGLTFVQVFLDGREATNLETYIVTSEVITLPADNLFGADPTRSVIKAYFMVLTPMSRGEHVLRRLRRIRGPKLRGRNHLPHHGRLRLPQGYPGDLTAKSCHSPGTPLSACRPASRSGTPPPRISARSLETRI
jgi:hypothetical protein